MFRYLIYFIVGQVFNTLAWLVAPLLPIFATLQDGRCNNNNAQGIEPRLPRWLNWFMTPDNSLWGDHGWQTEHCPNYKSYWGMVKWLLRNRAYGFNWTVIACPVDDPAKARCTGDLGIDRNNGRFGSFKIVLGRYWQHKWVKRIGRTGYLVSLNTGWLLDPYIKNPATLIEQPKALFIFSPRLGRVKTPAATASGTA